MSEKILLIKAKGGLGNRMLSAVSGVVFAELTGRTPVIDWRDGSYAPLGDNAYTVLFDAPPMPPAEAFDDMTEGVDPEIWRGHLGLTPQAMVENFDPARHSSALVYRRFCTDLSRLTTPDPLAVFWCYLPKFGRLAPHMRRDPRFRRRPLDDVMSERLTWYFTPNACVRARVAEWRATLPEPVIGVHVRYTDRKVPLAPLKRALRRKLAEVPGASIFLATDNGAIQTEFANEFEGVRFIEKMLRPDGTRLHMPSTDAATTREAENALIDMHLLGGCDHLICSRHSTFAVTAALIGAIPAARMVDTDRWTPQVVIKRIVQNWI